MIIIPYEWYVGSYDIPGGIETGIIRFMRIPKVGDICS